MVPTLRALFLTSLAALTYSPQSVGAVKFFQHLDQLPQGQSYDFIVVGSGAGGGTVATRLAEGTHFDVLVIEAGPSDEKFPDIQVPGLFTAVDSTGSIDWNFTTVPQAHANNRITPYSRAKVLGGCTSHNGMFYTRGSKDDYDQWATIVGDSSFSWREIFPYILKNEKYIEDVEHQDETNHLNPAVHGHSGKLGVSAPYSDHPINDLILETTKVLKDEFPFKLDFNDGRPIGLGWSQNSVREGIRSSSASEYISTAGDNLHVLLNTYVTRVLPMASNSSREKDFRRVELANGAQGPLRSIEAKREVIIAGGVINTPQILLNSGIGSTTELQALGIQPVVNNPSVGKNFSDQVMMLGAFRATLPTTDLNITSAREEWDRTHAGPLSHPSSLNHVAWVRLPKDLVGHQDPAPGVDSPQIEFFPVSIVNVTTITIPLPPLPRRSFGSSQNNNPFKITTLADADIELVVVGVNLHPTSRGSIGLKSSNPFDPPNIDLNFLDSDIDIAISREVIRSMQRFFNASPWKGKVAEMDIPPANIISSDDLLDAFLRDNVSPTLHGVGSASMSPKGASWGVVDPDFRVKGTTGLRIVDASVLPFVPSGHTQVPVYAFAERASDLILESWK